MGKLFASKTLFEFPFVLACIVLSVAAFGVSPIVFKMASEEKKPVPLTHPLSDFTKTALGEYKFLHSNQMEAAIEDALGTSDYIDWLFEDTSIKDTRHPLRNPRLFVTYYTGGRDLVPHTPDQCYLGAGYEPIKTENLNVDIRSINQEIPIRAITFQKSAIFSKETPTVLYTFHCNGVFVCTRNDVRLRISSPMEDHAYFCKIEVTFGTANSSPRNASREDTVKAASKFLNSILPKLLYDHLPDWEKVNQAVETNGMTEQ